ncbi:UNVERIFIED_CONTAM: fimbrillin family protein, partial [Bacteroidetes bacterium 56_B9]
MLNTESGASRTVIGIVFQTDPNRIGTAEKSKLGEGNVHGLVMAVKSISGATTWGPPGFEVNMTKCDSKKKNYNDISGYG